MGSFFVAATCAKITTFAQQKNYANLKFCPQQQK
jgi:hypothetical protein